MFIQEQFGKSIRKYRNAKSLTTAELAERLDVSPGLINNIENAKYDVFKFDLLNKLLDELDVPLAEVMPVNLDNNAVNHIKKQKNFVTNELTINDSQYLIFINTITSKYASLISEFDYNEEKVKVLSEHLINLLDTFMQVNK